MTHVVTESCIKCKHTDCVDVCPVDCFRETPLMLVIDPDECIDCGVCVPECPVSAILPEEDVPPAQHSFIQCNAARSRASPSITRSKGPMPDADVWRATPGKALFLNSELAGSATEADLARQALYQRIVASEALAPAERKRLLVDPDPMTRLLAASRQDFRPDKAQLSRGLSDDNEAVRRVFVEKAAAELTQKQVDALLGDRATSVRLELVRARSSSLTAKQREKALCDLDVGVRLAAMSVKGFLPTQAQFFRALESGSEAERRIMFARMNTEFVPRARAHASPAVRAVAFAHEEVKLSPDEIAAGIDDPGEEVRFALASRTDFRPTPRQFAQLVSRGGLNIASALAPNADAECVEVALSLADAVSVAAVIRSAAGITTQQLRRCLADDRIAVAMAALERIGRKLTESQLAVCLDSPHERLRLRAVAAFGPKRMSPAVLARSLADSASSIRALAVELAGPDLSADQLRSALDDRAAGVRLAAAGRAGFQPTLAQYRRGRADDSEKVRALFAARFKVSAGKVVARSDEHSRASSADASRRLRAVLRELAQLPTWTARKFQLKDELEPLLDKLGYIQFRVDSRDAPVTGFGSHKLIDVPPDKRGNLQPLRGQRTHIICMGGGTYGTALLATKAVASSRRPAKG